MGTKRNLFSTVQSLIQQLGNLVALEAQYNGGKKDFDLVKKAEYKYFLPQSENKDDPRTIISNASASLIDLGDGVACLNFHSKMNAINTEIVELTQKAIDIVSKDFKGLVIGNDAEVFSAGAKPNGNRNSN